MISQDGIIDVAEFCPSPNFDERPKNCNIDLLVIHAISLPEGNYNTQLIKDLFFNKLKPGKDEFLKSIQDLKVSSHFLITRQGALIQFVPTHKRAWHAGQSNFKGRVNCNDFSIGIELEGCDKEEFEEEQYFILQELTRFLLKEFSIPKEAIVGHVDIAPSRKTDPGPYFAWEKYTGKL
jgi:AmpD protein